MEEDHCLILTLPISSGLRQHQKSPTDLKTKKMKEPRRDILIISISLVALAFTVFVISGFVAYRNRSWACKKIVVNGSCELMEDIAPRSFTYAEIEKVTNGFQEEIGRGSSGTVYRGKLNFNNQAVAVKRLENTLAEGDKEFQNEIKVIGKTHHRNLVRLLGFSLDGPNKLLVYEYMVNGSLADVLFESQHPPRWDERTRIALDIARGILYLHEECETWAKICLPLLSASFVITGVTNLGLYMPYAEYYFKERINCAGPVK